ncbi:MAG: L-rhamnose/proton symporter RhaT [Terriglobia bacterium]
MDIPFFNLAMLALAGIAGASFGLPMKYFRGWRWEHVWIGQSLTANVVFPLATLLFFWPIFKTHLTSVPTGRYLALVVLGMIWGLGGIGYGLSLALFGLSFTYSVLFSVTTICGAVLPLWIGLRARPAHPFAFWLGLGFCLAGTVLVARAAARRSREREHISGPTNVLPIPVPQLSYTGSLCLALLAGVFSASMGLALVVNEDLVDSLLKVGISPVIAPLIVWAPLGLGAGLVAISYGLWCAFRSSSLRSFYRAHPRRNWTLVNLMGVLGFGVLLLYGFGASAQGHPTKNVAWAVYMASFILSGNGIGVLTQEWQDCSRHTRLQLLGGIVFLLGAIGSLAVS